MALIGTIRKNSWILIVMVGLGLGGFILMDMTSGQQSPFGGRQTTMGSIEGRDIDYNQFSQVENMLYRGSSADVFARRTSLWNYFVEESIIKKEAEELGLGVSPRELKDLEFGANPSSIILQRFMDPTTGQINRELLNTYKTQIESGTFTDPNQRAFWAHQEQEIIKEQIQSKLNMLVSKSLYTPTWMAEFGNKDFNSTVDFAYVKVPFGDIPNTEVTLSDSDYEAFIQDNKARFETEEESRKIGYVVFEVNPTPKDTADLLKKANDLVEQFEAAEDDSLFVERNLGFITNMYLTKEELSTRPMRINPALPQQGMPLMTNPAAIDSVTQLPVGQAYGPFNENGNFKIVKLLNEHIMADSADTRHILINAATPTQQAAASKRIDSLMNVIQNGGASWDSLALKFSEDPGSKNNGGKYEGVTPNQFVPEFNEVLFVTGEVGKLYKVKTSFGYHLVEVLSRNSNTTQRYKVALIEIPIIPSENTENNIYDQVQQFVLQNSTMDALRTSVADDPALSVEVSPAVFINDYSIGNALPPSQSSRDIIRWAFKNRVGEVSPELYAFEDPVNFAVNMYVVAGLESIIEPGLPSVDDLKAQIEQEVINLKKGEIIANRIASQDLSTIAGQYKVSIDTASNVTFNQGFVANLGNEPKVIAASFSMTNGQMSEPIVGNTGVFKVQLTSDPRTPSTDPNIPQLKQQMSGNVRSLISTQLIQSLKESADIEDNRARFY